MPHLILEHSADLGQGHDLQALCDTMWELVVAHPSVTGPETVRVRTIAATASRIGVEPQSFVHATLLLLPGRSDEVRQDMAQMVLDALDKEMPEIGSISVRLDDLNPPYIKRIL
ncbi:5-carboxymethyl-2-hydroxymuconate isomerase [Roseovarius sp. EL26]|uniref:5-carboxymethyl-2-hydroxymuconate isomerase n=1 Tax=Roseovarius sp. EL26 TaxID=2126672 RepID=UPI000EA38588|nr:5-carboxymethyl-2-hydroxymuconate isomerase [Roseovarius sp. EL26]